MAEFDQIKREVNERFDKWSFHLRRCRVSQVRGHGHERLFLHWSTQIFSTDSYQWFRNGCLSQQHMSWNAIKVVRNCQILMVCSALHLPHLHQRRD